MDDDISSSTYLLVNEEVFNQCPVVPLKLDDFTKGFVLEDGTVAFERLFERLQDLLQIEIRG